MMEGYNGYVGDDNGYGRDDNGYGGREESRIRELEYKEVNSYWRTLTVIRFKLLAFVPTLAGLGVALIPQNTKPLEAFAIGLFGFIATLGITFYDQRNSQLYNASITKASDLERKMNSSCVYLDLFTWDNVPKDKDDSKKLLKYLKYYHSIDWAKRRNISKCDNDNAICIDKRNKSAKITMVTKEKATLEINDDNKRDDENKVLYVKNAKSKYPYDLNVKNGDNKLKIYDKFGGGIFNSRPVRSRTFFGILMWHDRALAMVYASALGAWLFIIFGSIQNIIMDFHHIEPKTFSLLLSVLLAILLAIVIYIFLPKD